MRIITGVVVRVASAVDVSGRRVIVALGVSARSAQFVPQPAVSERVLEVREGNDEGPLQQHDMHFAIR